MLPPGGFKSYDPEELKERGRNEVFAETAGTRSAHAVGIAAEAVGPIAVHGESDGHTDPGNREEKVKTDGRMLYVVRFLETKHLRETIPATSSIVNQINAQFRCKAFSEPTETRPAS